MIDPLVEKVARALCDNHLEHAGGADGEALVAGTPNWKFFTRDAETAIRVIEQQHKGS
jgi:hypothetical protein